MSSLLFSRPGQIALSRAQTGDRSIPVFSDHRITRSPDHALSASEWVTGSPDHPIARADPRLVGLVPASRLERPAAPAVSTGIAEVDEFVGGFPRGALTEICGAASSGRSSLLLAALAEATQRQELCALVDASDSFDPHSAVAIGLDLERLLWVRCSQTGPEAGSRNARVSFRSSWMKLLEQALKTADLLLQGGGFGLVAIDLADVPPEFARRVPLASWFRFRRAVERTPTVLLVLEQEAYAKSCASLVLRTVASGQWPVASKQQFPVSSRSAGQFPADRSEGVYLASRKPEPETGNGDSYRAEMQCTFPLREPALSHGQLFCGMQVELELLRQKQWPVVSGQRPVRKTVQRECASGQSLAVGAGH
jgi:hypothetical protein